LIRINAQSSGVVTSRPLAEPQEWSRTPDRRVIAFVDNAGADIVLGMLPLARELLRMGSEVYTSSHLMCNESVNR